MTHIVVSGALWCLALAYFVLALISAFAVKRGQAHAPS
jgi:ABC-2 type transport system permease protein